MKPKNNIVSVVIPTHSGADVIQRAVDSVLAQTYKFIEIIVVDDNGKGSQKQLATEKSMKKYELNDKVKYIVHNDSCHGSAARNTGVKHSLGSFIALLDDDDSFIPNNIEKHLTELSKCDDSYAVSYCDMRLVRNEGESLISSNYNGNILYDFLCGRIRIGSSLIMFKKSAWESVDGFDESFKRHQDWEFLVRVLYKYKICHIDNVGVVKINLGRNNATTPECFEFNRIYYLQKMNQIIGTLSSEQQKEILNIHYTDIAKSYFKAYKIFGCIRWLCKTSAPITGFVKIIMSGFVYLLKIKNK